MNLIIHDLKEKTIDKENTLVFCADGNYAPCQGCFHCWTKHPDQCFMKDRLQHASQLLGQAENVTIITENYYGHYSPNIKAFLDRSIATSTPLSTYRGKQMHHTLRYGRKNGQMKVYVYGDTNEKEKETFRYLVKRNAINEGYQNAAVFFLPSFEDIPL